MADTQISAFLPATASRAAQLVSASARKSFDPFREIDWDTLDDSAFHLPPAYLPLYGTAPWEAMTRRERIEYSRHEAASLCGAGIWLENILMRVVIDHLYDMRADHPAHRYLLVEVADECRHSSMFAEFIRRAGTSPYRPTRAQRWLGKLMKATYGRAASFIAILAAEELLDVMNRATTADKATHAVSRGIARIHIIEEARHMSFARTYLEEVFPTLGAAQKWITRIVAPFTVRVIADALINPEVYEGAEIAGGYEAARNNPHHRDRVARDLGDLVGFLREIDVVNERTLPLWRTLGLLPKAI